MAGVKTERTSTGHYPAPKRDKDWTPEPRRIVCASSSNGVVAPGATFPARAPQTDAEKAALNAYEAAVKMLGRNVPNDRKTEGAISVTYARLVQLGLRPALRRSYRA